MKAEIVRYSIRNNKKSNKFQKDFMDLDYPSEKKNDLSRQLNQVDRRYGSIVLSNPKVIGPSKPVSQKIKKKAIELISGDKEIKLVQMLQQKTITLTDEISKDGHAWTILHYIGKHNSNECMKLCLRWLYQTNSKEYEQILNQKNCDEDTPLIIACINKSNLVVKTILDFGMADIYSTNSKKLTAYQIALSSSNEEALQMLMKYEVKVKKKNFINKEALNQPLPQLKSKTFQKLYEWLIQCCYFGQTSSQIQQNKNTETDRRMMKNENSDRMGSIQIEWIQPQKMYQKKVPLFSSVSQPFLIKQSNIIVSNLLIVFQNLAQHTQLLKKIIISVQDKYCVRLGGFNSQRVIWVDNLYPYFIENKQPLFLWLEDQLWPMVLQKALSQYYNGYFEPAKVPVEEIIESITGNQYFSISLSVNQKDHDKQQIKSIFLKIQSKNCILILKSKDSCPLKPQQGRIQCFSLLKIQGNKFLINCPFVITNGQINDSKYTIQMKLAMAHYQNPFCTTVWVDETQFFQYFSEAVFCHTLAVSNLRTSQTKVVSAISRTYVLIKIKQQSQNDKVYLTFKNKKGKPIVPVKCVGWALMGGDKEHVQKINAQILGIVELSGIIMPSQVLLMCQFGEQSISDENSLNVICRSQEMTSIEPLDCAIGDLQFIQCCKKYYRDNYNEYNAPIIQSVGDYVLAMAVSQEPCYIPLPICLSQDNVIEGMFVQSEGRLQMFQFGKIYFSVLSNVNQETLRHLKIMTYESVAANVGKDKSNSSQNLDSV